MQIPKTQPPKGIRVGIFTNRNPQNANTQNETPRRHTRRDFHESQPPECKYPKRNPQKAYVWGFSRIATPRMQILKMQPPEGIRVGIFTNRNPQNANIINATTRRHTCRDFHESQPPECKHPKCNPQKAYVSGFSRIATPRMQIPKMQPPERIRVGILTNRNPQNANTQNANPRRHTCRDFHESQPPECKYPKRNPQKAYVSGFLRIATPRMQLPKMQPPEGIRVGIFTNRNPQNATTQNATPRRHTCRDFHESQPLECKYPKRNPQKAYVSGFLRIGTPRMQLPKMQPPEGIRVGIFTNRNPQNAITQNATPRRHTCRDFYESQPPECNYPKRNPQKAYVSGFSRIATPRMQIPKMRPPEGIRVGIFTNRNPQNANTQNATPRRHTCRDFHES